MEEERPNWDKIGANMNAVRTKTLLQDADVVVVRFGEKYRQWNAAVRRFCSCVVFVLYIQDFLLPTVATPTLLF